MKRFTATEKWQKDWFQSLSPGQKCLWNYLCDNCDAGGVWEPNWRLASFVINETFTADSLAAFGDRVRVLPDGKIWLTGFCEFQYSHLSRECRAHIHIIRILEKHGLLHEVSHLVRGHPDNPADTLWHRVADRDKEKDTDKDQETETDSGNRPTRERASSPATDDGGDPAALAVELLGRGQPGDESATSAPTGVGPARTHLAALGQRVGAIMRRGPGSRWSERERAALGALFPLAEDDLVLLERYYGADIPRAEDIRRRDLLTLLDHWPGELDRARAFARKRGWRTPAVAAANLTVVVSGGDAWPEGFEDWKAQASEYDGAEWRDWPSVPEFARGEFARWKRQRRGR